jgi:hypothetical protein
MFGGKVDESAQTLTDPQWGTKYSLVNGDVVGKWCPSPPIIGSLIGALFPPQGVWVPEVRESNGYIEVKLDVDVSISFAKRSSRTYLIHILQAKAEFEKKFWKGILDAQGKADGGYY